MPIERDFRESRPPMEPAVHGRPGDRRHRTGRRDPTGPRLSTGCGFRRPQDAQQGDKRVDQAGTGPHAHAARPRRTVVHELSTGCAQGGGGRWTKAGGQGRYEIVTGIGLVCPVTTT
ncbi:hypothetical protein GCM10023195_82270 [Actinoallomurus liliacearum]|uniref:Uncharacterized protein n=1 Tax=Actinoallomurus liliacearum TaxID=1080073 RepID=A0ABP8TYI5_9ACTN